MPTALIILLSLIGITPVVLFVNGTPVLAFGLAAVAAPLVLVAQFMRPGEAAHLSSLIRPLVFVAILPALYLVLQTLPLPLIGQVANPVWQSAASALGRSLTPSISIDTGATLLSLCQYLLWVGIVVTASALGIDRQRAEWILFAVTTATVVTAALLMANELGGFLWLDELHHPARRGGALDAAVLGTILCASCVVRAYERFETRRTSDYRSRLWLIRNLGLCVAGFVVCAATILVAAAPTALYSAAAGLATLVGVVMVRRFGIGLGGALTVALLGAVVAVGIIANSTSPGASDLTMRFASRYDPAKSITARMLTDAPWIGSGAGTFHDLVPIYRGTEDPAADLDPPSVTAQIALELGRPLLWIGMCFAVAIAIMYLRAAMSRGRDSFYASAGASAVVALVISAFCNAGSFEFAMLIVSGALFGLALAQTKSRSV